MDGISQLHKVPIQQWIEEGAVFKFWGDNIDKKQYVRDLRSDHQGEMLHMFSVIVGKSRTPATEIQLDDIPTQFFLPISSDVAAVKDNLAVLVGRILTQYFRALEPSSKSVPKHILHKEGTDDL